MAAEPDLDALAERLRTATQLEADEQAKIVLTLAERHNRRVIAPLIDLLASRRADELFVRAAGWLADPAFHPVLVRLAASRIAIWATAATGCRSTEPSPGAARQRPTRRSRSR